MYSKPPKQNNSPKYGKPLLPMQHRGFQAEHMSSEFTMKAQEVKPKA
ncbi:hypothetical protein QCO44_03520 [Selenomonas sputigena]|uniref:Uncharacterized protein n=1 Tax=Selenomonas sputigena TaxID=69823 RepID=A0ABV3X516_9FIRM